MPKAALPGTRAFRVYPKAISLVPARKHCPADAVCLPDRRPFWTLGNQVRGLFVESAGGSLEGQARGNWAICQLTECPIGKGRKAPAS